ncbi:SDR family oxidoreductase [Megalodesulfovibrio gigas]|uniref:Putative NAD-dependent epimerase/dehydratase n=1 Tax=Megalodesulfovibrio gigas (strain ATCC 19364 / DSM 1382 / NCIMB 9332 / VKM B-1759) TaxID=1121448 RepID=T2G9K8_MEGG1|nr:SDR family oxidoreductase [Megalodesulfovibrio gigas]AGW12973.1 putative NAD-dependent epimerase/dehydratase [Megalodesulfovibrio gigas DSM 1382 = ATCC 19364]
MQDDRPVLVTGATGYIGGRLAPLLLERGHRVRVMVRSAAKLGCRPWAGHPRLEIVEADVFDYPAVRKAAAGCRAVYYLIHSMNPLARDYAAADRLAAHIMMRACENEGVERILYLGGMGQDSGTLSAHLQSRNEVAAILAGGTPRATILRAAQILGAGSASFEIVRYLADRLPLMVCPRWVYTEAQPVAVRDVLHCLAGCLEHPETAGEDYDIAGPDVLTYKQLFRLYCEVAGLPTPRLIPVPVLTPFLSSLWVGLVTPIPASLARPLVQGLKTRVVARDNRLMELLQHKPLPAREAMTMALDKIRQHTVETCWSDAGEARAPEWLGCGDAPYAGGTVLGETYRLVLDAPAAQVWQHVTSIGGENGWLFGNILWKLRGWLDTLAGGPGLRRGRRHPEQLFIGDAVDFWRVLDVQPNRRLMLLAEMRLPGEALLEFRCTPLDEHRTELVQRSRFLPRGLWGLAYWWATFPLHLLIFKGMLRTIGRQSGAAVLAGPERVTGRETTACSLDALKTPERLLHKG